jgi:hypothetical protein
MAKVHDTAFRHVIPGVGLTNIRLYPPADDFYLRLKSQQEVSRLNKLRHLGALSHVLQGARQARWDYTLSILYYISELDIPGFNSRFSLEGVEFSSQQAALQTVALAWNVGHLPGTYSVEKGVCQYLHGIDADAPAKSLRWSAPDAGLLSQVITAANQLQSREDYSGVARVLAILKLLRMARHDADLPFRLVQSLLAPVFLGYAGPRSIQVPKLKRAFQLVRHLAYLTLDQPLTGLQWAPPIPALFRQVLSSGTGDVAQIDAQISEVLSPVERATYECVYHNIEAREEVLLISEHVRQHLEKHKDPQGEILRWLGCGLFRDLKLGRTPKLGSLRSLASFGFRSHFLTLSTTPAAVEAELRRRGFSHSAVLEYRAWNSEKLLEPDEFIVDVRSTGAVAPEDVGKLLVWAIVEFDDLTASIGDVVAMLAKAELEPAYISLVRRVLGMKYPGVELRIVPWPLEEFGLLRDVGVRDGKGAIWASNSRLDDPITSHILRDRSRQVDPAT